MEGNWGPSWTIAQIGDHHLVNVAYRIPLRKDDVCRVRFAPPISQRTIEEGKRSASRRAAGDQPANPTRYFACTLQTSNQEFRHGATF
ncbi:hypothetical protein K6L09_40355 [Burkholderia cepacia]